MRTLSLLGLIVFTPFMEAFETRPWIEGFVEFHFIPSFTYRHYSSVNGGYNPSSYSSNDRFTRLDLILELDPWEAQLEIEFADTRRQSLGTQSAGAQILYQWMDDRTGHPVSLTSGLNMRWASKRSLKDVSCPYHAEWNFELCSSVGKEWQISEAKFFRTYGFLGVGQANAGRPWIRALFSLEALLHKHHRLALIGEGYFGFGNTHRVNIDHFRGYANVFHQSVELGTLYEYIISDIWGKIALFYSYRLFAKDFPAHANTVTIEYRFPFSLF